ncbi:selenide, water dikinase SelD [Treponema primitia]|uniref:selenide, water dikinase SelD n=1 Tax=Treponema primitia TaxID=88058 RepID=UPI00025556BC|nr:selenide, water dikinase SelD [Treponema primitia]
MGKNTESLLSKGLLSSCTSGGCGAKIESDGLARLLAGLPASGDKRLLVGYDTSDDAAVYMLDEKNSLIFTADFFPPMVDDARTFGRIAAANALSDVWAMGGKPMVALNLVCFPEAMEKSVLADILAGGAEKIAEAGAVLGGGHSIYDREPKYGLAVTGMVETAKVIRNNTPKIGHKIILTKPLGVGIVMAALRVEMAGEGAVRQAIASMERLNRYACESMAGFNVSACTDVTGFGLLVHALEMAGDQAAILLYPDALPLIPEAVTYANEYLLTAAGQRNRNRGSKYADVSALPFATQELLFDPQTSGGLLIAVPPDEAETLTARIREAGDEHAAIIGEVAPRAGKVILFR